MLVSMRSIGLRLPQTWTTHSFTASRLPRNMNVENHSIIFSV